MSQPTRILLSLALGLIAGVALARLAPGAVPGAMAVAGPIGNAWLHALQMVIVPLIVSLLVVGIGQGAAAAAAGRIAGVALLAIVAILWAVTLMSAIVTPAILAWWPLPPDWAAGLRAGFGAAPAIGTVPGLSAFLEGIVPHNVLAAAAGDSFLPLTVFALAFAFAVTRLPAAQRDTLTAVFQAVADAMIVIIGWVIRVAPIGVAALALGVGARTGTAAFGALAHYIITVCTVGTIVLLAAYPLGAIGGRIALARFARAVAPAQAVALSTQSSLATLPTMLKASEALGAPAATAGIVLPIAVAVFRATSPAMNLAVGIYVAHLVGVPLGAGQLAAGVVTAAITTMASVSLPGTISFIASTAPVALAMGVPLEALGLLIAVETIPDLFRTVGNVTADVAVTVTVAARGPQLERGATDAVLEGA